MLGRRGGRWWIWIVKAGKPVARLGPMERTRTTHRLGGRKATVHMAEVYEAGLDQADSVKSSDSVRPTPVVATNGSGRSTSELSRATKWHRLE